MTKGERMATPPWMPPEFGNDAVLIKALGDRINELCHQLERVEHDRDRYASRISELYLLIQTAEDYAKAQDERIKELGIALERISDLVPDTNTLGDAVSIADEATKNA